MMFERLYFFFSLSCVCLTATYGQHALSYECNGMRAGDCFYKEQVSYIHSGKSGESCFWDFSQVKSLDQPRVVSIVENDISFVAIGQKSMYHYKQTNDSLKLTKMESPFNYENYLSPLLSLKYPFAYGDSLSSQISGNGMYCNVQHTETKGTLQVVADGYGIIVLSEDDTLKNTLRLNILRVESIRMNHDTVALDSSAYKQKISESYVWYTRGYRYPVFATQSVCCYDDAELVSLQQRAFRYIPDIDIHKNDSANQELIVQDSILESKEKDITHYTVYTNNKQIEVNCSFDEPADVMMLVSDVTGVIHHKKEAKMDAGTVYNLTFDCNGIPANKYILYINVRGRIYSEKIVL